jgi:mRNA interferase RelE/StbE
VPDCRVEFRPAALRFLESLPQKIRARLVAKVEALGGNPYPPGVKKLSGSELHRVRSGDYRIVYKVGGTALVVLVVRIGTRGEVYRGL